VLAWLLLRWAVLAVAFTVATWLLDGMTVSGGFFAYLWVSALFGIVNAVLGTILRIFTLPLIVFTLGLFLIVINALMLELVDAITRHLTIDHFFWTAIWAAIIISAVGVVLHLLIGAVLGDDHPATA
jgi:putative membrane protein